MADTVTISTTTDNVTITPAGSNTVTLSSPVSNTVTVALGVGAVNLSGQTTDSLNEGSSNLYYTNARASAAAPVQSVTGLTGMNVLTDAAGAVSITNTKLGTVTGVTMPSGYSVADVSGALTVSYNNLAAIRTDLGLVPGTSANQIVQLDGDAKLPAVDGSQLTNLSAGSSLPASGLTSGSLSIDLIPNADGTLDLGSADFRWAEIHGDLEGSVMFRAKNGNASALSVGDVVYISGYTSGNTPDVDLADADDAAKMPSFGVISTGGNSGAEVYITTLGTLEGIDLPSGTYSAGDELFVSTTAGDFTNTAPTGESAAIQKIGFVIKANTGGGTNGSIKVLGAGRSNATPNLDSGKIFYGNGSNQAVSTTLTSVAEAAGSIATHNAITTAHGISTFGATLVDDADAATARTTLGAAASNHTHTLANITDSGTAAAFDVGITSNDVLQVAPSGVTANEFLRLEAIGTKVTSRTAAEVLSDIGAFAASGVSAFGGTLIDDADAAAARTTLNLGTAATTDSTNYAGAIHTHTLANITDAGTAAASATGDFATAAQGTKADSALQDVVSDTTPQLGGDLDVQAQKITTSTSDGNLTLLPDGSGHLEVGGSATSNVGKIRLMCEAGTHGVGLKSPPHSAGANYDLVLPTATGSADQALKTDGSGNLGWSSFVASSAVSAFGGTLIDDADAAAARTTLGATAVGANVFTAADQAAARSAIGVGTGTGDMVGSNNLSDVTNVATARTNLGATTVGANVFTAADAAAARSAIGAGSGTGDLVASNNLSDLNSAATARTNLGITNTGSYTGQIETAADKTYTLDPAVATARTISAFYIKTGSGSVVVNLKNGSDVVKQVTAGTGTGNQTGLANTSLAADAVLTLVTSSNSSATDVIFSVEYTE